MRNISHFCAELQTLQMDSGFPHKNAQFWWLFPHNNVYLQRLFVHKSVITDA